MRKHLMNQTCHLLKKCYKEINLKHISKSIYQAKFLGLIVHESRVARVLVPPWPRSRSDTSVSVPVSPPSRWKGPLDPRPSPPLSQLSLSVRSWNNMNNCHTRPNLESNLTWILQDLTCKLGHEVVLFSARMTRPDTSVSIAVELAICFWRVSERCFYVSGQWLSVYWCVSRPDPTPPDLTYYFQLLQNLQYELRVSKKCSYVSGKSLNMSGMFFDVPRR